MHAYISVPGNKKDKCLFLRIWEKSNLKLFLWFITEKIHIFCGMNQTNVIDIYFSSTDDYCDVFGRHIITLMTNNSNYWQTMIIKEWWLLRGV